MTPGGTATAGTEPETRDASAPGPPAAAPPPPAPAPPPAKGKAVEELPPLPDDGPSGPPPEEGAPAWVMTFGDLMSLLLTFFILLFSMSTIEVEKFKAAAESLNEAFGEIGPGFAPSEPTAGTPSDTTIVVGEAGARKVSQAITDIASVLQQFVQENEMADQVVVSSDANGVYLRIQDVALFRPGSSNIEEASVEIVQRLGMILQAIQVPVVVSGHTDDRPIRSPVFFSNWELSAARAAGVARLMVAAGHEPASLTVEAYGEYRPLAPNDTEEGRSQNRRVELFYSRQAIEDIMRERGLLEDQPAPAAEAAASEEAPADVPPAEAPPTG